MYYTADRETGTFIDQVNDVKEGERLILEYEKADRGAGIYTPDFYSVVNSDHCEVTEE